MPEAKAPETDAAEAADTTKVVKAPAPKTDTGNALGAKAAARLREGRLQIDGHGLPVNTHARRAVLAQLKAEDPADGGKWTKAQVTEATEMTEKLYG